VKKNKPSLEQYDEWGVLSKEARPILNDIVARWEKLIHRNEVLEQAVHRFLETHAHLFFHGQIGFATVISKLRFGADHVTDFVVVHDNWSAGILYHLVEIERPDIAPFTKEGIASARLSRAIQQILSWKTWLSEHPAEAQKLFPSSLPRMERRPAFAYEIIIGNRKNSKQWLERRNVLADSLGISIRSFDSLTTRVKNRLHFDNFSAVGDEQLDYPLWERNVLSCPFLRALSDKQWRELLGRRPEPSHFMHAFGHDLIRIRKANRERNRFRFFVKRPR
jgi:hypothetical protein